jgi:hypothetical protein
MPEAFSPIRLQTPEAVEEKAVPIGRVPLFYVGQKEYTIPVDVPGSLTLQALDMTAEKGEVEATVWVMKKVLGEDGYKALLTHPDITKRELAGIQKVIRELVFGEAEEEGKG